MSATRTRLAKNRHVVVGAGLIVLDLLVSDELDSIQAYGGTCGNILVILAFLGWDCYPIARLGKDGVGNKLREDFRRFGLRDDFVTIDDRVSTPVIIQQNKRLVNGDVAHRFVWRQCPQCGEYLQPFRPPTRAVAQGLLDKLEREDFFIFDRVAPATIALAEASAAKGSTVVFEPSSIGSDQKFERALRASHVVKYSADRIKRLPRLSKWNPRLEIRTNGRDGLGFRLKGGRWKSLSSVPVPGTIRDTSGAGDWTTAGFIHRIQQLGVTLEASSEFHIANALRYGQSVAAVNCGYYGARGAMYALQPRSLVNQAERLLKGERLRSSRRAAVSYPDTYERVFCSSCVD
jgi:sugar/nucleoside kinase (ribokinase family)